MRFAVQFQPGVEPVRHPSQSKDLHPCPLRLYLARTRLQQIHRGFRGAAKSRKEGWLGELRDLHGFPRNAVAMVYVREEGSLGYQIACSSQMKRQRRSVLQRTVERYRARMDEEDGTDRLPAHEQDVSGFEPAHAGFVEDGIPR